MAQESTTIARPYAQAVFARANEAGNLDQWSDDLAFIDAVMQDDSVRLLVNNPNMTEAQITELMLEISSENVSEEGCNLLRLLVENDRLDIVSSIAEQFEALKSQAQGTLDVQVTTAFPLSEEQQASISAALKAKLGREININSVEDPEIIGGMHIRAGDLVIDGSVQGQLKQLANELGI